jgi:hypothetical protein
MKKKLFALGTCAILLLCVDKSFSQSSSASIGNVPSTGYPNFDFLGWASGSNALLATGGTISIPELVIKNDDPMSISFYTNAGGGYYNLRMWIKDDGGMNTTTNGNPNDGFVGIGDFTITGSSPQHLLHLLDKDINNVYEQFTNKTSDHKETDGLLVGINDAQNYLTAPVTIAKMIQQENGPMKFYTGSDPGGSNAGAPLARMIINSDYTPLIHGVLQNTNGYVGIGTFDPNAPLGPSGFWEEELGTIAPVSSEGPRSLLHMQGPFDAFNNGGLGWRGWMKTGTYLNENSDEMYVGLKNEGQNMKDAIINC